MNSKVLFQRGIIGQKVYGAGVLKNHALTFNVVGIPFLEPSFASVEESRSHSVHGVVISLDYISYLRLCATEAVPVYYIPKEVEIEMYSGETVNAFTLQAANGPFRFSNPLKIPPSDAYLKVIREGAREAGLKEEYCNFLESIPPNSMVFESNWRSKLRQNR